MQFGSLSDVNISTLAATFNHAFSDYVVPLHLSDIQFQNKLVSDSVRLELSAGVFDDGQLIGFILHGYDEVQGKPLAYNAGTGVIPEKRGQKFTARMYDFMLPKLKAQGIQSVHLEVITSNVVAHKTYRAIGFETLRTMDCYKGKVQLPETGPFQIKKLDEYDWPLMQSFWDWQPSWQNSVRAVTQVQDTNISLGAYEENELIGYMIYNPISNRVQQFAVSPKYRRRGVGRQLFAHLVQPEGRDLVLVNIDHGSHETDHFLRSLGMERFVQQYEMTLPL